MNQNQLAILSVIETFNEFASANMNVAKEQLRVLITDNEQSLQATLDGIDTTDIETRIDHMDNALEYVNTIMENMQRLNRELKAARGN